MLDYRSQHDAGVAELADAPDLGSGGRPWGFKSLHPHHLFAGVAELGRRNRLKICREYSRTGSSPVFGTI